LSRTLVVAVGLAVLVALGNINKTAQTNTSEPLTRASYARLSPSGPAIAPKAVILPDGSKFSFHEHPTSWEIGVAGTIVGTMSAYAWYAEDWRKMRPD
jgi:hypothetical protein